MTPLLALLLIAPPAAAPREEQEVVLVEPIRSPWARPSGVSRFRQYRSGDWRVSTWTDNGSVRDRVVRLQRWRSGYTLVYERYYRPGDAMFDRAEIVVGNCTRGDPIAAETGPKPGFASVRDALLAHLAWCDVAPEAANRMLQGFERAWPLMVMRSRAAAINAAMGGPR